MIKVLFCLCFFGDRVSIKGISGSKILKGFIMCLPDVHSYDHWLMVYPSLFENNWVERDYGEREYTERH